MREDFYGLYWDRQHVKVKRIATESRSKDTVVKIELVVSDGHTLAGILRDLDDAKRQPEPKRPAKSATPEPLALPAPTLQLGYRGRGVE